MTYRIEVKFYGLSGWRRLATGVEEEDLQRRLGEIEERMGRTWSTICDVRAVPEAETTYVAK